MAGRQQLLQRLDKAWVAFNKSYAGLSDSQLMEPGVSGTWSVRDILTHVTTWEEEVLKRLPLILSSPHDGTETEPFAVRGPRSIGGNAPPARRLHSERPRASIHWRNPVPSSTTERYVPPLPAPRGGDSAMATADFKTRPSGVSPHAAFCRVAQCHCAYVRPPKEEPTFPTSRLR